MITIESGAIVKCMMFNHEYPGLELKVDFSVDYTSIYYMVYDGVCVHIFEKDDDMNLH